MKRYLGVFEELFATGGISGESLEYIVESTDEESAIENIAAMVIPRLADYMISTYMYFGFVHVSAKTHSSDEICDMLELEPEHPLINIIEEWRNRNKYVEAECERIFARVGNELTENDRLKLLKYEVKKSIKIKNSSNI
jgi:hypothetical protein